MDYQGQKLCEYIYSIITILFGAIAWMVGYYKGDFIYTFYGWAAGVAISLVVSFNGNDLCSSNLGYFLNDIALHPWLAYV